MDWLTRMNAALQYIEDNLTGQIDYDELARIACCSYHNFFRIFSTITDISLAEYIRRRRLTLAALELRADTKIIDLALKYGYDSPVSFARAFHALHGITPSEARTGGVSLKAYPRLSFQISIKGEKEMDYRVETKEAFQLFGIEEVFPAESATATENSGIRKPANLWEESHANGNYVKLDAASGGRPPFVGSEFDNVHAVCDYRATEPGTFPYMLCAYRSAGSDIAGYTVVDVPAHTWAIFPTGKFAWEDCGEVLGQLYKRIFGEWMPTSGYEQVGSLDMELYGGGEDFGLVEVWLAVRKM